MAEVQRARLPGSERSVWLVVGDDFLPIEPIRRFLDYLDDLERSPNASVSFASKRSYAQRIALRNEPPTRRRMQSSGHCGCGSPNWNRAAANSRRGTSNSRGKWRFSTAKSTGELGGRNLPMGHELHHLGRE